MYFIFIYRLRNAIQTADQIEYEESQEGSLDGDRDHLPYESASTVNTQSNSSESNHITTNKSDSRGKKKKREWSDDEVECLISLWSRFDVLFNAKHPLYFNKDEKNKAITKIQNEMKENGMDISVKDIAEKIANLRNYYGAQRRMVEASKKSGAGTNEVYESKWKFFKPT